MPHPTALRALNHRNFRRFYFGQAISQVGSWMQSVAIMWLAYRLSGSTAATGTIGFLAMIPYLLVTPFAGALSDRMSRRTILSVVQLVLCANATVLTVLAASGLMTLPWLGALALLQGVFSAVEVTTRHSFFAELIDDAADLPNAIALNSVNINGTRLVGPALGGVVISLAGEALCFALNALSYLALVHQLRTLKPRALVRPAASASFLHGLAAGWRHALRSPVILPLVLMAGAVSFFINPYTVLMPAVAVETFARGAELHGLFISGVGLGALASAILLARRESVRGLSAWIVVTAGAAALGALAFFAFANLRQVPLAFLAMALLGFGVMGTSASVNTIVQSVTEDSMRGRVVSVYSTFFTGAVPLGNLAAGWTAQRLGAPPTLALAGLCCAVATALYALNLKRMRSHLREMYVERGIIAEDGLKN
jgi:MFS family permease